MLGLVLKSTCVSKEYTCVGIFQVEDDAASSLLPAWIEGHLAVNVFWETERILQSKDRPVGPQHDAEAFDSFQIFEIV